MVVCKFFLQGTCKFGDFCKFEHQMPENFNNYQTSTSILRQPHFVNPQQQVKPNPSTVDTNTLVKSVVNDMTVAEKGGQWLLSCYAPFKEKPAFPGFEDHSSEEIRLGYYEAVKNGTVEQYKQQVQAMLQQAVMRMKSLQSPSPDIVNLLKSIYNTPPSSYCGVFGTNTTTNSQSSFGNVTNTSVTFNQQQQQPLTTFQQPSQNIFGKPSQPQTQFGNTSTSIFGAGTTPNQIFGGQVNNSLFANTQSQAQNTANNIFRQSNSNFPAQSSNSIFGGQPAVAQPNSGSIFGGQPTTGGSVFGAQQPNSAVFGAQQANSAVFGAQQANPAVFGGQQNASSTYGQVNTGNIFGNSFTNQTATPATTVQSINQPPNIFNNQSQIQAAPKSIFNQSNQQPSVFNQQSAAPVFNQQQNIPAFSHLQNVPAFNQQAAGPMFMQQNPGSFNQLNVNTPPPSVTDAQSHSSSIFGSTQNTVLSVPSFSRVQQIDESLYSKLEDLSQEDMKWFESNDLDELKLPENPPTYDMCFKT